MKREHEYFFTSMDEMTNIFLVPIIPKVMESIFNAIFVELRRNLALEECPLWIPT